MTFNSKNSLWISSLIAFILLSFLFFQSQGVEGGLDSWNHYLISRSAIQYPELLLDQWNKPVFSIMTVLVCQLGMNALVWFNIFCILISAILLALAFHKKGFEQSWILIFLVIFIPILFENIISGLTEPLNILMLTTVFYFWMNENFRTSLIIASFLPFVRTEGFIILGTIILFVLYKKQFKHLFWLLIGTIVMNLIGFVITGKPLWIITENPYWKHEVSGKFDPGSGSFFHFFKVSRPMFGLPAIVLFVLGNVLVVFHFFKKSLKLDIFLISFLVFWSYFMAHTTIYYLGILGSHGLLRVMSVIVPPMAVVVFYGLNHLTKNFNPKFKQWTYIFTTLVLIQVAYQETEYAKPHRFKEPSVKQDKTQINFIKAGEWLIQNNLMQRTIVHQTPFFNVYFKKDPYNEQSSFYIWSIFQENDYSPKGIIVVWDGFSAVREGAMPLSWLKNNPNYQQLLYIEGFEKPENDPTMYDVYIFEKII